MAGDAQGNLWISNFDRGLLHLFRANLVQQVPWDGLGRKDLATSLSADPSQGGVWLGFSKGGLAYFNDGQIRAAYTAADGLGEGRVSDVRFDHEGALWVATDGGISRLKDGRITTFTTKDGLPCDRVLWLVEDEDHAMWLYAACGLVRIERSELDAWAADKYNIRKRTIEATILDNHDEVAPGVDFGSGPGRGVRNPRTAKSGFPLSMASASSIRITFISTNFRRRYTSSKSLPTTRPTGRTGRAMRPPRSRSCRRGWATCDRLHGAEPGGAGKVRFRYKLEGRDRDWQDVGNRRQAFYSESSLPQLPLPRDAHAITAGCGTRPAHSWIFPSRRRTTRPPGFVYCAWPPFWHCSGGIYQLRLQQLQRQFNIRLEERVNERTRIARDFHDTMLQTFQGVLLKFHGLSVMLADRPEAQHKLEGLLKQAQQAINEGREAVLGLRSSTVIANDLARAFTTLGENSPRNKTATILWPFKSRWKARREICIRLLGTKLPHRLRGPAQRLPALRRGAN